MARLYSDSLFHYTKELTTLQLIIKQGFKVSLAKEQYILSSDEFLYIDIPMVSFCDIPLLLIDLVTYGNLGIGMSRSWGTNNFLQPVYYFSNSKKANSNILERPLADSFWEGHHTSTLLRQLSALKPMSKYKDSDYGSYPVTTKRGIIKQYYRRDNYIEREWRKVYLDHWNEDYYTKNPRYIPFNCKDVSFLIVDTPPEKDCLIKYIMNLDTIGGHNSTEEDRLSLATKILVMQELKKNF